MSCFLCIVNDDDTTASGFSENIFHFKMFRPCTKRRRLTTTMRKTTRFTNENKIKHLAKERARIRSRHAHDETQGHNTTCHRNNGLGQLNLNTATRHFIQLSVSLLIHNQIQPNRQRTNETKSWEKERNKMSGHDKNYRKEIWKTASNVNFIMWILWNITALPLVSHIAICSFVDSGFSGDFMNG